jgi:hypothetical protein
VLAAIVVGSASGGAVVCLVLFVMVGVAAIPAAGAAAATRMPPVGPALAAGGGVVAGALVAWGVAKPLANLYLRAALAMMAVMGTALVAAATMPAHLLLGRPGLVLLAALCLVAIVAARRAFLKPAA